MVQQAMVCHRVDLHVRDTIGGKYSVLAQLGEGAFGIVYRVRHLADGQVYALKLLKLWGAEPSERRKLLQRFEQEYHTGRIVSDYLVQSIDWGVLKDNPYIVMEYCDGGDLRSCWGDGSLHLERVAQEVLYGLRSLHQHGKVHRDLKPENVLVRANGSVALTDFGISGDRNKRMTERNIIGVPQEIFGTYAYMPPEQVNPKRGDATVLPTTDIFSFGVMIYFLLTSKLSFGSIESQDELYVYVMRASKGEWDRAAVARKKQGKQWLKVLEGCLHSDFRQRFKTVDKVLEQLPNAKVGVAQAVALSSISPIVNGVALRIMQGENYGKVYKLEQLMQQTQRRVLTMGRYTTDHLNMIPITEEQSSYISRKHCTIEYDIDRKQWYLRDGQWDRTATPKWRNSLNGTFVGSEEIGKEGYILKLGDIVSIGDVKLRVEGY